jgi:hypothetical protein
LVGRVWPSLILLISPQFLAAERQENQKNGLLASVRPLIWPPLEFSRSATGKHTRGRVDELADDNQISVCRALLGPQLRERGLHRFGVPVDHDPETRCCGFGRAWRTASMRRSKRRIRSRLIDRTPPAAGTLGRYST